MKLYSPTHNSGRQTVPTLSNEDKRVRQHDKAEIRKAIERIMQATSPDNMRTVDAEELQRQLNICLHENRVVLERVIRHRKAERLGENSKRYGHVATEEEDKEPKLPVIKSQQDAAMNRLYNAGRAKSSNTGTAKQTKRLPQVRSGHGPRKEVGNVNRQPSYRPSSKSSATRRNYKLHKDRHASPSISIDRRTSGLGDDHGYGARLGSSGSTISTSSSTSRESMNLKSRQSRKSTLSRSSSLSREEHSRRMQELKEAEERALQQKNEIERLRREKEKQREEEEEAQRKADETKRIRKEEEAKRKREKETERIRKEEEEAQIKREMEAEIEREKEAERVRQEEEEKEAQRKRKAEEEKRRKQKEEEEERRKLELENEQDDDDDAYESDDYEEDFDAPPEPKSSPVYFPDINASNSAGKLGDEDESDDDDATKCPSANQKQEPQEEEYDKKVKPVKMNLYSDDDEDADVDDLLADFDDVDFGGDISVLKK